MKNKVIKFDPIQFWSHLIVYKQSKTRALGESLNISSIEKNRVSLKLDSGRPRENDETKERKHEKI